MSVYSRSLRRLSTSDVNTACFGRVVVVMTIYSRTSTVPQDVIRPTRLHSPFWRPHAKQPQSRFASGHTRKSFSARQLRHFQKQSYCCESTSTCTGHRHLRSAQTRQLVVPRTRTKYGDRSFAVQGPRIWNSLPAELRAPDISRAVFRNKLKTYLFDTTYLHITPVLLRHH